MPQPRSTPETQEVYTLLQPARDGFRFANHFVYTLPWHGARQIAVGLCGGMCFAALDYRVAGLPIPSNENPPPWRSPLGHYLWRRQWDSWRQGAAALRALAWMALSDRQVARRTQRRELSRLLASLDRGNPQVLLLLRATSLDPTRNHQVVATGYLRDSPDGAVTLFLYDPNHHGRQVTLGIKAGAEPTTLAQSTGEPLRGFFLVPYRPCLPPAKGHEPTIS